MLIFLLEFILFKRISIYFENVFYEKNSLIKNIKYYVNRNFRLSNGLSKKYKTLFYNKENIIKNIINIINEIIDYN